MLCNKNFTHTLGSLLPFNRVLLYQYLEGFPQLCRKSNASQLTCLLRGGKPPFQQTIHSVFSNLFILKRFSSVFKISIQLHNGHQYAAMWAYHSFGVHEQDESTPSVSIPFSSELRNGVTWQHPLLVTIISISTMFDISQLLVPRSACDTPRRI